MNNTSDNPNVEMHEILSSTQERLWFLSQLDPDSPAYNERLILRLTGCLSRESLEQALNEIVKRHEPLRTGIAIVDGQPTQFVAPFVPLSLDALAVPGVTVDERERNIKSLLMRNVMRGFDIRSGDVLRALLWVIDDQTHILQIVVHHIAADGGSMAIFMSELVEFYSMFSAGKAHQLPVNVSNYRTYSIRQRKYLESDQARASLGYWKTQLVDAPASIDLCTDQPRALQRAGLGRVVSQALPQEALVLLKSVCRQNRVTMFMSLLASLAVLLWSYTGQVDILIGCPVSGRNDADVERLIGCFLNTLVLRLKVDGDLNFRDLLGRTRAVTLAALAHQSVPVEHLIQELRPIRHTTRQPLFQVMFAYQSIVVAEPSMNGLEVEFLEDQAITSKTDLSFVAGERPQGLLLRCEYDAELFDVGTVERMVTHWGTLLKEMASAPERKIADLAMLTDEEVRLVLHDWNDTTKEFATYLCVHELFEAQVNNGPDTVAMVFEDKELTYRELNRQANRLAHYLRSLGIGPEKRVGICVERGPEMIVGLLGILKAGGAYVPLDPSYPDDRLQFMLRDSAPAALLTQGDLKGVLSGLGAKVPIVDLGNAESVWKKYPETNLDRHTTGLSSEHLAYVIYTSGSTGLPKGVMVEHRNLVRLFAATDQWFQFNENDVWSLFHSYAFDFSVWEIWGALCYGGRLIVVSKKVARSPEEFYELICRTRVTVLNQTPSAFRQFCAAQAQSKQSHNLRYVIFGGEAFDVASLQPWYEQNGGRYTRLVNMYGITETTVHVTYRQLEQIDAKQRGKSPIGCRISDLTTYIVNANGAPTPIGVAGELYIGGAGVARGYLNRPGLTAERFVPDPFAKEAGARMYRSGDLARWLADGSIEYLGRNDFQVKIRGFRIEPGEIEAVLREQPGVHDAAVLAREDMPGDKRLVAYVAGDVDVAELRSRLSHRLPDYMVPAAIVPLEQLPLTVNGKLDRQALPLPGSERVTNIEYAAPRTPVEELLCGVWERVLQVDRVGSGDNFFELGGHSLLATQVISQVRRIFGVEVPLRQMFETPTVVGFAAAVEEARRRGDRKDEPALVRVASRDALPLSYAQQRLWFLDQLDPGSAVYNIPVAMRLQGSLEIEMLERSIAEVMRRHEVLRTRFEMRDGGPVQIVESDVRFKMDRADLRGEPDNESLARSMATAEASCPFDLSRAPLLRCKLLQLGDEDYVVLLTMHHSVSDGWSMGVLVGEMATLYRAYLRGEPSPLPELKIQYADYAVWQRKWLQGEILEDQLHYWEKQLHGLTPLELPADHPRPPVFTHRGDSVPVHLQRDLLTRLKSLAQRRDLTLFMVLLSGFELLLQRYSGQNDITIGTAIANRLRAEWQGLIGYFANTIAIRADLSSCETVEDLFSLTRDLCLDAYANQDLPLERLVDHLNPEREPGHTPLFQTVFVLQNTPVSELNLPDVRWSLIYSSNQFVKFDLEFVLEERDDELFGSIGYATDLFRRETIEEMLENWTKLLEELTIKPERRLSDLDTLTSEEKHLLDSWNCTARAVDAANSLHELCIRSVCRTPDALAVVAQDGTLTYRQLDEDSTRIGHLLIDTGVKRGDLVAVYLDRTTSLIAALLAVLKTGAAYVPLDLSYPFERIEFILSSLNIHHLLTTSDKLAGLAEIPKSLNHAICIDSQQQCLSNSSIGLHVWRAEDIAARPTHALKSCTQLHDVAYIIFTSGSTGVPKGVMIPHGPVINVIDWLNRTFDVGPQDRILCTASVSFDLSVYDIFGILAAGGTIHIASRSQTSDPDALLRTLMSEPITIWDSAPATLQQLSTAFLDSTGTESLSALRLVLLSGDWIPTTLPSILLAKCPRAHVISLGGATEATIWSNFYPIHFVDPAASSIPYGVPIQNASYHVLDSNLTRCNIGVPGDLYIGGKCLAYGYVNQSALTASSFIPAPFRLQPGSRLYRTGDRARWHKDGNLEFLGRCDGQVKIRGFRVETGEIESVLLRHLMVTEAVVMAREDSPGDKRLVAYYTGAERSVEELRRELRRKLPEYMIPAAYLHLERLPLTPNGKLDRKALPAPTNNAHVKRDYEKPEGVVEHTIAQLWAEVLNVERVGRQDNFFELGGHSLLAVTLIERMRQIGMEVNVRALFSTSTVAGFATTVGAGCGRSSEVPANRIPVFGRQKSDLSEAEEVRI